MSTLLAHLAAKFSDQNEVVATDALAFVLRQSPAARNALQSVLSDPAGAVPVARVTPQFNAGEDGRPDLAAFARDGSLSALVEAKFWFGLMDTQPVAYLRRLREEGGKALLFIVPQERVASMMAKLEERAKSADPSFGPWTESVGVHAAAGADGVGMKVTSWKHLLLVLEAACARADEPMAVANVQQLSGLVSRFEAEGFRPMSGAELTDLSVPRRVRALAALVRAVLAKGQATHLVTLAGSRPRSDWTTSGSYFGLPSSYAWIGVDHDAWAKYQTTPVWLWFPERSWCRPREVARAIQAWETTTPRRLYVNDDDTVSVPLFVPPAAESDDAVDDLLGQLHEVERLLAAAGLVRAAASPRTAGSDGATA